MLTKYEFEILKNIKMYGANNINELIRNPIGYTGYLASVSEDDLKLMYKNLTQRNYIKGLTLTSLGEMEIASYKVQNAIILAAGGLEMSPKLLYSVPKGLYKMNNEPIIERQIKQLFEAGIKEIYVVVGYKKEMYFYLEEKYGVILLVNQQPKKHNVFSLWAASQILDNTYVCSCDNYYPDNPFELYVYDSYHATIEKVDSSRELCVTTNMDGRITSLFTASGIHECLYGHSYFNKAFSRKIGHFIDKEIFDFRIDSMFWQEFYAKHIDDLDMNTRKYANDFICEFDSIQELQLLDDMFIENISAEITQKICSTLCCEKGDIANVSISDKGFSNIIINFSVFDKKYVLRYPGDSASLIISRKREMLAQKIVSDSGIDNTFVYIDENGCKISKFIPDCHDLTEKYYKDMPIMMQIVSKLRKLHGCSLKEDEKKVLFFDPIAESDRLLSMASPTKGNLFDRFKKIRSGIIELCDFMENDGYNKVLSHIDFNISNILLNSETLEFIDWEFAGYTDPGFDFGRILDGYEPDSTEVNQLLEVYLGHSPRIEEQRHFCGGVALHSWYFFCWCLYKESINEDTSFYMTYFYHRIIKWMEYALCLYKSNIFLRTADFKPQFHPPRIPSDNNLLD
jgi:CTP:phosphocholine cytidylyltransferase-like protein/thiamine kinase-like enzyme